MGLFKFKIFLILILLTPLQMSCSSLQELLGMGYQKPEVTLSNLEIQSFSLTSIKLLVSLSVKNPNTFEISLDRMDYQFHANGMDIAQGMYEKNFKVKAQGKADIKLPLKIDAQNAYKLMQKILENPEKEYPATIEATILFDSPIGKIEKKFVDEKPIRQVAF